MLGDLGPLCSSKFTVQERHDDDGMTVVFIIRRSPRKIIILSHLCGGVGDISQSIKNSLLAEFD